MPEAGRTETDQGPYHGVQPGEIRDGVKVADVLRVTKRYVVYIDDKGGIWWEADFQIPPEANAALAQAEVLQAQPTRGLEKAIAFVFIRMVGQAIISAIDGDILTSKQLLDDARKYLAARRAEAARMLYFFAGSIVAGIFIGVGGIIAYSIAAGDPRPVVLACSLGALGAFLSIMLRMNSRALDPEAGLRVHAVDGVARILVGAISGLVLWLIIASKIDLGAIKFEGAAANSFVGYLFCLIAGVSERLVPDFVAIVEQQANQP